MREEQLRTLEKRVKEYEAEIEKKNNRINELEAENSKLRRIENGNVTLCKKYKEATMEAERLRRDVAMFATRSLCSRCARNIAFGE